jgi:hypothetical protein
MPWLTPTPSPLPSSATANWGHLFLCLHDLELLSATSNRPARHVGGVGRRGHTERTLSELPSGSVGSANRRQSSWVPVALTALIVRLAMSELVTGHGAAVSENEQV